MARAKPTRRITDAMRDRAIQNASGHFLTEHFPENWNDMDGEELNEFIDDHTWEPLEGWEAGAVFELIENAASATLGFLKQEKFVA